MIIKIKSYYFLIIPYPVTCFNIINAKKNFYKIISEFSLHSLSKKVGNIYISKWDKIYEFESKHNGILKNEKMIRKLLFFLLQMINPFQ